MPSIIVIELMFLGVNMFLALLRTHFSSKMSLSRAINIFTHANINSIVIFNNRDNSGANEGRGAKPRASQVSMVIETESEPSYCFIIPQ